MSWLTLTGAAQSQSDLPQGASPWHNGDHDQMRLLWRKTGDNTWQLALHLRLDQGWKTYWRLAGDSGIDPVIDLSASSQHRQGPVTWPRPTAYQEGDGYWSFGYKDELILPFDIEFTGTMNQVTMDIEYGVCETICLPEHKHISLTLPGPAKKIRRYLDKATEQQPDMGNITQTSVLRDGHRLTLPHADTDGDLAIVEIRDSALIATRVSGKWVMDLPPGKRKSGLDARIWLITAENYHVRQFRTP